MAACDAWSLKADRGNLRIVEILQHFEIHSVDRITRIYGPFRLILVFWAKHFNFEFDT